MLRNGFRSLEVFWLPYLVVKKTLLAGLRLFPALPIFVAQLGLCQAPPAEDIAVLAPGLQIALPAPLKLSLEQIGQSSQYPVVVGEIDKQPAYFISAVKVRSWERRTVLWEKLEMELRRKSGRGTVRVYVSGSFSTHEGASVSYKGYEYVDSTQAHRPLYFLVRGEYAVYWITLVAVEGVNMDVVVPVAEALLQRVKIVP